MKRFAVVLFFLLFLFSGCARQYTYNDVQEMKDDWDSKYYEMEEKYEYYYNKYIELQSDVNCAYDDALALKAYFLGWEEASFSEAKKAIKSIYDRLYPDEW